MEDSKMAGPVIPERYRAALGDDDPFLAMFEAPQALLHSCIQQLMVLHPFTQQLQA